MLNETWLQKETLNKLSFPGYLLISKERIGKKGGGFGILLSNFYKSRQQTDLSLNSTNFEHLIIEVKTKKSSVIIMTAYRPPNTSAKEFMIEYQQQVAFIQEKLHDRSSLIIGLDHNMDFLKSNSHQITQDFLEYNFEQNLIPLINRPTRITRTSAMLIDNIFVSQDLVEDSRCGLLITDLSDHLPCLMSIQNIDPDTIGANMIISRTLNDTKMTNIKHDLGMLIWKSRLTENLQNNYDTFELTLTNVLDRHAPFTNKTTKGSQQK